MRRSIMSTYSIDNLPKDPPEAATAFIEGFGLCAFMDGEWFTLHGPRAKVVGKEEEPKKKRRRIRFKEN